MRKFTTLWTKIFLALFIVITITSCGGGGGGGSSSSEAVSVKVNINQDNFRTVQSRLTVNDSEVSSLMLSVTGPDTDINRNILAEVDNAGYVTLTLYLNSSYTFGITAKDAEGDQLCKGSSSVYLSQDYQTVSISCVSSSDGDNSGGTDDGDGSDDGDDDSDVTFIITGVAASGLPLQGYVYLKDANGEVISAEIAEDGSYELDTAGLTAPFMLKAEGVVGTTSKTLYAFTDQTGGTMNINPYVNLATAAALNVVDIDTVFEDIQSYTEELTFEKLKASSEKIAVIFADVFEALGATGADPLSGAYSADSTGIDGVLDYLEITLTESGFSVADKSTGSSVISGNVSALSSGTASSLPNSIVETVTAYVNVGVSQLAETKAFINDLYYERSRDSFEDYYDADFSYHNAYTRSQIISSGYDFISEDESMENFQIFLRTSTTDVIVYFLTVNSDGERTPHYEWLTKDGDTWYATGNERMFGRQAILTSVQTIGANDEITYNTGLTLYTFDRQGMGIEIVVVTGPGLPESGIHMVNTGDDFAILDSESDYDNIYVMSDSELAEVKSDITNNGYAKYTFTAYESYDTNYDPVGDAVQAINKKIFKPVLELTNSSDDISDNFLSVTGLSGHNISDLTAGEEISLTYGAGDNDILSGFITYDCYDIDGNQYTDHNTLPISTSTFSFTVPSDSFDYLTECNAYMGYYDQTYTKLISIWQYRADSYGMTASEYISEVLSSISTDDLLGENTSADAITTNLALPSEANNLSLTWTSSDTSLMSNSGTPTRPAYSEGDQSVTMTVTTSYGEDTTGTETYTFTVSRADNNAPVASDTSVSTNEDTAVTIDLTSLGSDADGDSLTYAIATEPSQGAASISSGVITYTPDADYNGSDTIEYSVTDGYDTSTGTVTITVSSVNDAPVASDTSASTNEDTAVTIDLTSIVSDTESDTLTYSILLDPSNGTASISSGVITYTPDADYYGADTIGYYVSDGTDSDSGTITVTISSVNDAPTASDVTVSMDEDSSITVDLSTATSDAENDTLTYAIATEPSEGTASISSEVIAYTPDADFNGSDTMTYTVTDENGDSNTGTINFTINAVNDAPVASDNTETTLEDTAFTVDLTALVSDIDGDDLTYTISTDPSDGAISGLADGSLTYTPDADYNGSDSFVYTVSDGTDSDTGTITVTITAYNDAPDAVDDTVTISSKKVTISVTDNDSDVEDESVTVTYVSTPSHGTTTDNGDGTVTYELTENYTGDDTFSYTIEDTEGATGTATVTVTIEYAENDATLGAGLISDATVEIYHIDDLTTPVIETTSSGYSTTLAESGIFTYATTLIDSDDLYVIMAYDGYAADADYDEVYDGDSAGALDGDVQVMDSVITNEGNLYAIASGEDLINGGINVNVLTDIIYRKVAYMLAAEMTQAEIIERMDSYAATLVFENLDGDSEGEISNGDALVFDTYNDYMYSSIGSLSDFEAYTGYILDNTAQSSADYDYYADIRAEFVIGGTDAYVSVMEDSLVYSSMDTDGINVYDISINGDPSAPVLDNNISYTALGEVSPSSIAVDGTDVYATSSVNGIMQFVLTAGTYGSAGSFDVISAAVLQKVYVHPDGDYIYGLYNTSSGTLQDTYGQDVSTGIQVIPTSSMSTYTTIEGSSGENYDSLHLDTDNGYIYAVTEDYNPGTNYQTVDVFSIGADGSALTLEGSVEYEMTISSDLSSAFVNNDNGAAVYTTTGYGFTVIDVSDPAAPAEGTTVEMQSVSIAVSILVVSGDKLYAFEDYGSAEVYDISDPLSPEYSYTISGTINDIANNIFIDGSTIYQSTAGSGLVLQYDSDFDDTFGTEQYADSDFEFLDMVVDGDTAYAVTLDSTNSSSDILLLDNTDPDALTTSSTMNYDLYPLDASYEMILMAADRTNYPNSLFAIADDYLLLFNDGDSAQAARYYNSAEEDDYSSMLIVADKDYMLIGNNGYLEIVSLSGADTGSLPDPNNDPDDYNDITFYDSTSNPYDMVEHNGYVYAGVSYAGLQIIKLEDTVADFSDASITNRLTSTSTENAYGVEIIDNQYLAVAGTDYGSGVAFYDLTDPENPYEISSVALWTAANTDDDVYMEADGDFLYIYDTEGSYLYLHVIDTSDISNPRIIYSVSHSMQRLAVGDSHIYMLDKDIGLSTIKKATRTLPYKTADYQAFLDAADEYSEETVMYENTDPDALTSDLNLPTTLDSGLTVAWTTDNTDFLNESTGEINIPDYFSGDEDLALYGEVTSGSTTFTIVYNFTIAKADPTDDQLVTEVIRSLSASDFLTSPDTVTTSVTTDLTIPTGLDNSVTVRIWETTDTDVIGTDGAVTAPYPEKSGQTTTIYLEGSVDGSTYYTYDSEEETDFTFDFVVETETALTTNVRMDMGALGNYSHTTDDFTPVTIDIDNGKFELYKYSYNSTSGEYEFTSVDGADDNSLSTIASTETDFSTVSSVTITGNYKEAVDSSALYLLAVSGGVGLDLNYDDLAQGDQTIFTDDTQVNLSTVYAVIPGSLLATGGESIYLNPVTDLVFRNVEYMFETGESITDIESALDNFANAAINTDIDSSGTIDGTDPLYVDMYTTPDNGYLNISTTNLGYYTYDVLANALSSWDMNLLNHSKPYFTTSNSVYKVATDGTYIYTLEGMTTVYIYNYDGDQLDSTTLLFNAADMEYENGYLGFVESNSNQYTIIPVTDGAFGTAVTSNSVAGEGVAVDATSIPYSGQDDSVIFYFDGATDGTDGYLNAMDYQGHEYELPGTSNNNSVDIAVGDSGSTVYRAYDNTIEKISVMMADYSTYYMPISVSSTSSITTSDETFSIEHIFVDGTSLVVVMPYVIEIYDTANLVDNSPEKSITFSGQVSVSDGYLYLLEETAMYVDVYNISDPTSVYLDKTTFNMTGYYSVESSYIMNANGSDLLIVDDTYVHPTDTSGFDNKYYLGERYTVIDDDIYDSAINPSDEGTSEYSIFTSAYNNNMEEYTYNGSSLVHNDSPAFSDSSYMKSYEHLYANETTGDVMLVSSSNIYITDQTTAGTTYDSTSWGGDYPVYNGSDAVYYSIATDSYGATVVRQEINVTETYTYNTYFGDAFLSSGSAGTNIYSLALYMDSSDNEKFLYVYSNTNSSVLHLLTLDTATKDLSDASVSTISPVSTFDLTLSDMDEMVVFGNYLAITASDIIYVFEIDTASGDLTEVAYKDMRDISSNLTVTSLDADTENGYLYAHSDKGTFVMSVDTSINAVRIDTIIPNTSEYNYNLKVVGGTTYIANGLNVLAMLDAYTGLTEVPDTREDIERAFQNEVTATSVLGGGDTSALSITADVILPSTWTYDGTTYDITWASSNTAVVGSDGMLSAEGTVFIVGTITDGTNTYVVSLYFATGALP